RTQQPTPARTAGIWGGGRAHSHETAQDTQRRCLQAHFQLSAAARLSTVSRFSMSNNASRSATCLRESGAKRLIRAKACARTPRALARSQLYMRAEGHAVPRAQTVLVIRCALNV